MSAALPFYFLVLVKDPETRRIDYTVLIRLCYFVMCLFYNANHLYFIQIDFNIYLT